MCKDDEGVRVRKARAANSPAFEAETGLPEHRAPIGYHNRCTVLVNQ